MAPFCYDQPRVTHETLYRSKDRARACGDFLCLRWHDAFREARDIPQNHAAVRSNALGNGGNQRLLRNPWWYRPADPSDSTRSGVGPGLTVDRSVPGKSLHGDESDRSWRCVDRAMVAMGTPSDSGASDLLASMVHAAS